MAAPSRRVVLACFMVTGALCFMSLASSSFGKPLALFVPSISGSEASVVPLIERHHDVFEHPSASSSLSSASSSSKGQGDNARSRARSGIAPSILTNHIFYLHIQKAGTSFFNTVYLHWCPRVLREHPELRNPTKPLLSLDVLYGLGESCYDNETNTQTVFYNEHRGVTYHYPLELDPTKPTTVVTMFRDPYLRARSAFLFSSDDKLRPMHFLDQDANITFEEYINIPRASHCQTAMLVSKVGCYDEKNELPNITQAIELIQKPNFFFGITERWDESICLFHRWFGGSKVQPFELHNNRQTSKNPRHYYYHHMLDNVTRDMMPKGDLDIVLYEKAEEIFDWRLKEAGCYGWNSTIHSWEIMNMEKPTLVQ